MFVVDRFDITPGWSNRTLLINNLNEHHEVSEKFKNPTDQNSNV